MNSIYEVVDRVFDALTWVAVIAAGYAVLDWLHDDDSDPDGYA